MPSHTNSLGSAYEPEYHLPPFSPSERRLLDSISVIAVYDCPIHDPTQLCNCATALATVTPRYKDLLVYINFIEEWRQHLLKYDAAINFVRSKVGKNLFRSRTGISHYDFAREFATETFASPSMTAPNPKSTQDFVIGAMFSYWHESARTWSATFSNADQTRQKLAICQSGDVEARHYRDLSELDPMWPQIGKRLVLQRVRLRSRGGFGVFHSTTIYLLPTRNTARGGIIGPEYKILGMKPCHEGCAFGLRMNKDVMEMIVRGIHGVGPEVKFMEVAGKKMGEVKEV